jgi:hypothetical protein
MRKINPVNCDEEVAEGQLRILHFGFGRCCGRTLRIEKISKRLVVASIKEQSITTHENAERAAEAHRNHQSSGEPLQEE